MTHAAPMNADRWNALQDRVVELEARVEELVRQQHHLDLRFDGGWWADCVPSGCGQFIDEDLSSGMYDYQKKSHARQADAERRAAIAHKAHVDLMVSEALK